MAASPNLKGITIDLVQNALDYILSASEHVQGKQMRDYKYAVLHLAAGIELLLKARLAEEHWSLIIRDIKENKKANIDSFLSGKCQTVNWDEAKTRLKSITRVHFDKISENMLDKLFEFRNKLQHFAVDIDEEQATSLLAKGINFVVDFSHHELKRFLKETEKTFLEAIGQHLLGYQAFIDERMKQILSQLANKKTVIDCPICQRKTLVIGEDDPHCLFCNLQMPAKDFSFMIGQIGIEGGICFNCGKDTLAYVPVDQGDNQPFQMCVVFCTSCGHQEDELDWNRKMNELNGCPVETNR